MYVFVNGSKNLYGLEQTARIYIKADKVNGGVNSIDVESFLKAIMIEQAAKAISHHSTQRALQQSVTTSRWHIVTNVCRTHHKKIFEQPDGDY